jgi:hypothetical protein
MSTPSLRKFFILKKKAPADIEIQLIFVWCCHSENSKRRLGNKRSPALLRERQPPTLMYAIRGTATYQIWLILPLPALPMVVASSLQQAVHD